MAINQGYFLIGLGKQYILESYLLLETIRKSGCARPMSLLIHDQDREYAEAMGVFDKLIEFNPRDDLWTFCDTGFEKYCLYPRVNFQKYLPYEENIIVDSDVLCQYNPEALWNYMSKQPFPIRMLGRKNDPNWHWGAIEEVSKAYGKHVPHVHGGFFYLRNNSFLEQFFNYCKVVFYRYDEYKCRRAFRGGRVDEIIFAIAHSYFNMDPVPFDEVPAMTFNYTPDMVIPSKLQTEGGQNIELNDYIPFVHMFDKMDGDNFKSLYSKIMNGV
jgi:hypothetical protein